MELGIEGYSQIELIGRGGFGTVYRVRDEAHGRDLALKVLPALLDDSARRQFDRERRAMGALSDHPGIAVVHTSGFTKSGEPFIAMELLRGGSLADRLNKGPMPVAEALSIGAEMADALGAAHAAGILHLDVKPENILFTHRGVAKLVDFGIATLADDKRFTSTIRATPAYAAPEVLEGHPATPAADVYSLAVTLYAAIMGQAPFAGDSMLTVLRKIAVDPVPEITREDVPNPVIAALRRAMDKSPTERPPTMQAFADELRSLQAAVATQSVDIPVPPTPASGSTVAIGTPPPPPPPVNSGQFAAPGSPGGLPPTPSGPVGVQGFSAPVPAGGVVPPPDAPPPGSVPYETPKKKPVALIVGVAALLVAGIVGVAVVAGRGGESTADEPTTTVAQREATTTTAAPTTPAPTSPTTTVPVTPTVPPTPAPTAPPPTAPPTAPPSTTPPVLQGIITDLVWSTTLDENNRPNAPTNYFADGTTQICLTWNIDQAPVGAPWAIEWELDGVPQRNLGGKGVVGAAFEPYYACVFDAVPLTAGLYEVVWRVNDEVYVSDSMYVGGGRPPVTLNLVNNTATALCSVNLTPDDSRFWGSDWSGNGRVAPGASVTVVLSAGLYDLRALDCNGTTVHEQAGIDLQASGDVAINGTT